MDINLTLLPIILTAVLSLIITPFVIKLAWKLGLIDNPALHRHPKVIHTKPIPRSGGIALFAAFAIASFIFLPADNYLLGILGGGAVIVVIGIIDDYLLSRGKRDFSPYIRLGMQTVAALIPVAAGIQIAFTTSPVGGIINLAILPYLPSILAVVWIVAMMNFLNLGAKGVDGQLTGVVIIAAATIGVLSLRFGADITQWPVIILASITIGAYLGFLPYHIFPQKIMPAFSGSNFGGYILAILAILSTAKVGTLLVVLAVPLIDTGYVVIRRVLQGKSPVLGDRGHLHHRLLDAGWSKPAVAFFYWAITGLLGIMALNLNAQNKLYTIVGVAALTGGLILWLTYRLRSLK